jgi:hypothetical protein
MLFTCLAKATILHRSLSTASLPVTCLPAARDLRSLLHLLKPSAEGVPPQQSAMLLEVCGYLSHIPLTLCCKPALH